MLQVLRQYLPVRKALLIASETVLLTLVVAAVMSAHLTADIPEWVQRAIATEGLTAKQAIVRCFFSAFLVALIAQLSIAFNELYDFGVSSSRYERFTRLVGSSGLAIFLGLVALVLTRIWEIDRLLEFPGLTFSRTAQTLVFSLLLGFAALYLWRLLFHRLLAVWRLHERVLILGNGPAARSLFAALHHASLAGYEAIGVVAGTQERPSTSSRSEILGGAIRFTGSQFALPSRPPVRSSTGPAQLSVAPTPSARPTAGASALQSRLEPPSEVGATAAGSGVAPAKPPTLEEELESDLESGSHLPRCQALPGENLLNMARRLRADSLVVALEDRRGNMPTEELLNCRLAGLNVEEGEALYERVTGKIAVEAMRPSYLIFNKGFRQHPFSEFTKRTFDLLLAATGIALTWPLMLVTALVVRLDSPGPVLFRQERAGRFGQPIVINKFRSMRADAEKATGPVWATENDPRITRVGRFIRKTRLDELPQLFNVLGGSMSMVGPRPERAHFIEDLKRQIPYYDQRHIVKPGITGWAQINYPYGNTVEDALQKLQFDLFYIKYHSVPFDISIVIQTIKTVLLRRGT